MNRLMSLRSTAPIVVLMMLAAVSITSPAVASTTVEVTPGSLDGWQVFQGATTATVVITDAVNIQVGSDGDDSAAVRNTDYGGTPLEDLTSLSYATFVSNNVNCQAVYLTLSVDTDDDGTPDDALFFEPCYQTGTYSGDPVPGQGDVTLGRWQTWNAFTGGWWVLSEGTFGPPLVTLATYATAHPGAAIVNTASGRGGVRLIAGGGAGAWDDFVGAADTMTIGVNADETTYDFEPGDIGPCAATTSGTTITLTADCIVDETLEVPDGFTLDGAGHKVTAIDPVGGHFVGPVIGNVSTATTSVNVTNVKVRTSDLKDVCDEGNDRLRGIMLAGVGGSITNSVVKHIQQGTGSGCQEGNAIEVRNAPFDTTGIDVLVTVSGNEISDYLKTGILANGSVIADITGNEITGYGPIGEPRAAQNGIQIGFAATARVRENAVGGNWYAPKEWVSCGLLYFDADGVRSAENALFDNERDVCNFGRGGGGDPVH